MLSAWLYYMCEMVLCVCACLCVCVCASQEVGGALIVEDGRVVMAGAEGGMVSNTSRGFHVFDTIPFTPFQPIV